MNKGKRYLYTNVQIFSMACLAANDSFPTWLKLIFLVIIIILQIGFYLKEL